MKTAISVPDDTFHEVTERAQELGMSRSEFFSVAARRYLSELDRSTVAAQVNEALRMAGDDDSGAAAVVSGRRRLSAVDDW